MHPSEEQSKLIAHLFALFIRCPFGQAAEDCPFADIRTLQSLDLKFRLAEKIAMHPRYPENMRDTHGACYRERLRQIASEKIIPTGTQKATWRIFTRQPGNPTKERPWPSAFSCVTSPPLNMPLSR